MIMMLKSPLMLPTFRVSRVWYKVSPAVCVLLSCIRYTVSMCQRAPTSHQKSTIIYNEFLALSLCSLGSISRQYCSLMGILQTESNFICVCVCVKCVSETTHLVYSPCDHSVADNVQQCPTLANTFDVWFGHADWSHPKHTYIVPIQTRVPSIMFGF